MGKTVPSFRMALEWEIESWKGFRKALTSEEDKRAFDELMDMCRTHASEASCATRSIVFEAMIMSIALARQVDIQRMDEQINDIIWQTICIQTQRRQRLNR
jgi:hypothetical protein